MAVIKKKGGGYVAGFEPENEKPKNPFVGGTSTKDQPTTPKAPIANADKAFIDVITKGAAESAGVDVTGVTQQGIDKARKLGLDVFSSKNLQAMSDIDQAAQANKNAMQGAVEQALSLERQNPITPKEGTLGAIGEQVNKLEQGTMIGKLTGGSNIPNYERGTLAVIGAGIATAAGLLSAMGAEVIASRTLSQKLSKNLLTKFIGAGAIIATPMKIGNDAKAAITSSKQSLDLTIDSYKMGLITAEDAIVQFNQIQADMGLQERSLKLWSNLNPVNWLGGGKDAQVDIANARLEYQIKFAALLQEIAKGGLQQNAMQG